MPIPLEILLDKEGQLGILLLQWWCQAKVKGGYGLLSEACSPRLRKFVVMAGENLPKEHLKTRAFSPLSEALAPLWEDFWHHPCAVQLALIEFMDKTSKKSVVYFPVSFII